MIDAVGILQVFNELSEHPDYLPRVVASMRRVCKSIVAYDDGSTDGTDKWLADNVDHLIRGERNDWKAEIAHKQAMLDVAAKSTPHWILWLDADEELTPQATDTIHAREKDWQAQGVTGVQILETNLWRSREFHRVDRAYDRGWFVRLWRWRAGMSYEAPGKLGLHQRQHPAGVDRRLLRLPPDQGRVIHYSWDSPEKIARKHLRYAALGQKGEDLHRLLDSPRAVLQPVDPAWFWPEPAPAPATCSASPVESGPGCRA